MPCALCWPFFKVGAPYYFIFPFCICRRITLAAKWYAVKFELRAWNYAKKEKAWSVLLWRSSFRDRAGDIIHSSVGHFKILSHLTVDGFLRMRLFSAFSKREYSARSWKRSCAHYRWNDARLGVSQCTERRAAESFGIRPPCNGRGRYLSCRAHEVVPLCYDSSIAASDGTSGAGLTASRPKMQMKSRMGLIWRIGSGINNAPAMNNTRVRTIREVAQAMLIFCVFVYVLLLLFKAFFSSVCRASIFVAFVQVGNSATCTTQLGHLSEL